MARSSMEPVTVRYRLRECSALALGALSIVIFLSLLSYSPWDLGREGASLLNTENLIGRVGANFSHAMFWFVGAVAYFLPIALLGSAAVLVSLRGTPINPQEIALRTLAVLGIMFCSAVLVHIHSPEIGVMPEGPGGVFGGVVVFHSIVYLHVAGLSIIFSVGLLALLQYLFKFSWLDVLEFTGKTITLIAQASQTAVIRFVSFTIQLTRQSVAVLMAAIRRGRVLILAYQRRSKERNVLPDFPAQPKPLTQSRQASLLTDETRSVAPANVVMNSDINEFAETEELSRLPSLEILSSPSESRFIGEDERHSLLALGERLRQILADYKVSIEVESIITGPVVSRFEIQLAPGSKVSKIMQLANDLAREIAVRSVRVVPVIPGKSVVGIEIPNADRSIVSLKDCLSAPEFLKSKQPLTLTLGKDIAGEVVYADIEKMPHLLIAGTTGSGKSVGINTMLLSLLYRLTPEDVRMIMIDPKMLELSVYEGIPHLLTPVVTDMQDAAKALNWCVGEMERRYRIMRELQVRNLGGLNEKILEAEASGEYIPDPLWDPATGESQQVLAKLPLIVVIIDEFADMIMIVGKKVEQLIARIAQKARAAGIHLVLATQRPSVDVITGLIKANIPCRISYKVSSQVDSRTILDQVGAEQLLGHGDMLYLAPGSSVPERVHGALVSDEEVLAVIQEWRQRGTPDYVLDIMSDADRFDLTDLGLPGGEDGDDLYQQAVQFVLETKRASASALQTKFQIGWNKAARFMDQMEGQGLVSQPDQNGRRAVLVLEE